MSIHGPFLRSHYASDSTAGSPTGLGQPRELPSPAPSSLSLYEENPRMRPSTPNPRIIIENDLNISGHGSGRSGLENSSKPQSDETKRTISVMQIMQDCFKKSAQDPAATVSDITNDFHRGQSDPHTVGSGFLVDDISGFHQTNPSNFHRVPPRNDINIADLIQAIGQRGRGLVVFLVPIRR